MCKSKAEGGQRCYSHARVKLSRANTAVKKADDARKQIVRDAGAMNAQHLTGQAAIRHNEATGRYTRAMTEYRAARVEYGSTTRGHSDLVRRATQERTQGNDWAARQIEADADEGALLREKNYLVSRGHDRSTMEGTSPITRSVVASQARLQRQFDSQERQVTARTRSKGYDPDYPDWSGIEPTHTYGAYAKASEGLSIRSEYTVAGVLHRDDGPARVHSNGIQEHYRAGRRHNPNGPAVTFPDGVQQWFVHGNQVTPETHASWVAQGRPNRTPERVHPRPRAS